MSSPSAPTTADIAQLNRQAQAALTKQLRDVEQFVSEIRQLEARAKDDPKSRQALLALEKQAQSPWGQGQKKMHETLLRLQQQLQATQTQPNGEQNQKRLYEELLNLQQSLSLPDSVTPESVQITRPQTAASETSKSVIRRSFL